MRLSSLYKISQAEGIVEAANYVNDISPLRIADFMIQYLEIEILYNAKTESNMSGETFGGTFYIQVKMYPFSKLWFLLIDLSRQELYRGLIQYNNAVLPIKGIPL